MRAECGIDWLTVTIPLEDTERPNVVYLGHKLQEKEKKVGNSIKPATIQGYEGSVCGGVFVGEGLGGAMVRSSGFSANEAFTLLQHTKVKPTRIDLQVTVWYADNPAEVIRKYAEVAIADSAVADSRTKRKITTWEGNDGGYTLYIGARSSDYFGRLYDKHKESKDEEYKNALRFEVEIKGKRAEQAFDALSRRNRDRNKAIVSFVGEWYTGRGVYVPFLYTTGEMELSPIRREKSDTHRRMEWLKTQVRHTILELRRTVDSTVILDALGFFEPLEEE